MENVKKFFEEIIKTEEAKALIASYEKPKTEKECIEAYIDIAKKLGITLTYDGVVSYFKAAGELRSGELDDDELEQLTGGVSSIVFADIFDSDEKRTMSLGDRYVIKKNNSAVCGATSAIHGDEKRINTNNSCSSTVNFSTVL